MAGTLTTLAFSVLLQEPGIYLIPGI